MSESAYELNVDQIRRFLPHRFPFLMVDRIMEIHPTGDLNDLSSKGKEGTVVRGRKCVSVNEPFFQGHFPECAIFPGVLMIETMAQVASFSVYPYLVRHPERPQKVECVLVGVDETRFRKRVAPGDVLEIEARVTKTRGPLWAFECQARVDSQLVAEAKIMANWITGLD